MMRTISILTLPLLALVATPAPVAAQSPACTQRAEVIGHLSNKYAEKPVALGLANNGGVLEVLSSKKNGSWTIIITMPSGVSCMVAAGENWENVPFQRTKVDPRS